MLPQTGCHRACKKHVVLCLPSNVTARAPSLLPFFKKNMCLLDCHTGPRQSSCYLQTQANSILSLFKWHTNLRISHSRNVNAKESTGFGNGNRRREEGGGRRRELSAEGAAVQEPQRSLGASEVGPGEGGMEAERLKDSLRRGRQESPPPGCWSPYLCWGL